jgi:hypothetical protein
MRNLRHTHTSGRERSHWGKRGRERYTVGEEEEVKEGKKERMPELKVILKGNGIQRSSIVYYSNERGGFTHRAHVRKPPPPRKYRTVTVWRRSRHPGRPLAAEGQEGTRVSRKGLDFSDGRERVWYGRRRLGLST